VHTLLEWAEVTIVLALVEIPALQIVVITEIQNLGVLRQILLVLSVDHMITIPENAVSNIRLVLPVRKRGMFKQIAQRMIVSRVAIVAMILLMWLLIAGINLLYALCAKNVDILIAFVLG